MPEKVEDEELSTPGFFEILSHDARRRIIRLLYEKVEMSYTNLLGTLEMGEGTLNFHLRKLEKLVQHTERGTYILSEYGRFAYSLILSANSTLKSEAKPSTVPRPTLSRNIVLRRFAAFFIDALIFFVFTGIIFDPVLWGLLEKSVGSLYTILELAPGLFYNEYLALISEMFYEIAAVYAHVLFAIYIFLTLLEAYKGQTPGKYVLGIRVVKVGGGKVDLLESGIRNAGKIFLLPLDLLLGLIFYRKKGYLRLSDYYTEATVERVALIKS